MSKPVSFLDNIITDKLGIGEIVKTKLFDDYGQVIFISLIILLIILVIILYKYTFTNFNKAVITSLDYHKNLKLEPLPPCSSIPEAYQHRLCDYYIASSYNTPNIGKGQLDYVSADMISQALVSGARFIQLPICAYSVDQESQPVIAQSLPGKQQITSLNTVSTREALSTIRDFAFKYIDNRAIAGTTNYSAINYPLIIQLKLHTYNEFVLDTLYTDITDILGKYLVSASSYKSYPIQLEKLCNLLNKIIIISTPGYETTKLNDIVVPMTSLFQRMDKTQLAIPDLNEKTIDKYYESLSVAKQRASYKLAENITPILKSILDAGGVKELESKILDNPTLTDKLTIYNMVGMTLIEPGDEPLTDMNNYNPIMPFTYGCQFVAMNYQTNDEYMSLYIKIFQKNSFVLKPAGLRLPIIETDIKTLLDDYTIGPKTKTKPDPLFINKNADRIITLSTIQNGKYITPKTANRLDLVELQKPGLDNGFIVKRSPLGDDLIILVSALNPALAITAPSDFTEKEVINEVMLDNLNETNQDKLRYQSFYPDIGLLASSSNKQSNNQISFRLYNEVQKLIKPRTPASKNNNTTYYLGLNRNILTVMPNIEDKALLTFQYTQLQGMETIKIEHILNGSIKVFPGGLVALSKNPDAATQFQVVNITATRGKSSATSRTIGLVDIKTNKYLTAKMGILECVKRFSNESLQADEQAHFILSKISSVNDNYTIMDYKGNYLVGAQNAELTLKRDRETLSPAIKNDDGTLLKAARVSPDLGSSKYFKVIQAYLLDDSK